MRILVIDDSQAIRRALRVSLMRHGQVDTASSASQALQLMAASRYDWIIADISMADTVNMPAVEWLETINQHRHSASVIINSVNDSDEVLAACRRFSFRRVDKGDDKAIVELTAGSDGRFLEVSEIERIADQAARKVQAEGLPENQVEAVIEKARLRIHAECAANTERLFKDMGLWLNDRNRPNLQWVYDQKASHDKGQKWRENILVSVIGAIALAVILGLWGLVQEGFMLKVTAP